TRRLRALLRAVRPLVASERTEPLRAELGWLASQRAQRVPRPAAHLQPGPARAGASRLCPSLQSASAAPLARTPATRTGRQKPDTSASTTLSAAQSPRPTRRADPRIPIRSLIDRSPHSHDAKRPWQRSLFDTSDLDASFP